MLYLNYKNYPRKCFTAEQETFMAKTGKQNRDTNNVIREMNENIKVTQQNMIYYL